MYLLKSFWILESKNNIIFVTNCYILTKKTTRYASVSTRVKKKICPQTVVI